MFLSKLVVNVGDRSDRFRPGRRWIRQPYRIHQRLCMAFPNELGKKDPDFLQPFDPANFFDYPGTASEWDASVPKAVHVKRDEEHGFLFRIDADHRGQPFILVQSAREPDWSYAFHNARYLVDSWQERQIQPRFESGARLRFRLLANPTEKTRRLTQRERDEGKPAPTNSRRLVCLGLDAHVAWLERKSKGRGFTLMKDERLSVVPAGIVRAFRTHDRNERAISLYAVRFEGILTVTDPDTFRTTVATGIGSAKAFGFGLLSLAPGG